jgi:hypothetical protein
VHQDGLVLVGVLPGDGDDRATRDPLVVHLQQRVGLGVLGLDALSGQHLPALAADLTMRVADQVSVSPASRTASTAQMEANSAQSCVS